jgi:hypothetical protein
MNTMWKSLHEKWRGLPAHIRNGSLRLYLVICALCVVWFGYKILNVFERHSYYGPKWEDVVPLFWALLLVPVGGPILFFAAIWILEGFRKPQIKVGNLRDVVARDILCRPDIVAYEFLATGMFLGRKWGTKHQLNEKSLTADQKAMLPVEFYGPKGVDPDAIAQYFAYPSGQAMVDHVANLFKKWGYLDRDQMLNKVIDEEVDRRWRKATAHFQKDE